MDDTIQQQTTIPDQAIEDIIDTACEGGINYWCRLVNSITLTDSVPATPVAWDFYEIDSQRPIHVTAELMRKTLDDIVISKTDCDEDLRNALADGLVIPADIGCYIGTRYADCIVQFACFGEQRYG